MKLIQEVVEDDLATLIIGNPHIIIVSHLISELKTKHVRVLTASHLPPHIPKYISRVFCFSDISRLAGDMSVLLSVPNVIFISVIKEEPKGQTKDVIHFGLKHNKHAKIALIPKGEHDVAIICHNILKFAFDQGEQYTVLHAKPTPNYQSSRHKKSVSQELANSRGKEPFGLWILRHPKKSILIGFLAVVLVHILFVIPLLVSTFLFGSYYLAQKSSSVFLKSNSNILIRFGKGTFLASGRMYNPVKRGWMFIGLSSKIDSTFDTVNAILNIEKLGKEIKEDAGIMLSRMFDPQSESSDQIESRKNKIQSNLKKIKNHLDVIDANIPDFVVTELRLGKNIPKITEYLAIADTVLDRFDSIFGKDFPKTYAILFANNNEIRPGGGFIGSFALVKTSSLKIQEFRVYDVYDADGQLKARVRPPEPISTYLQQPFFFLRDSAFSPDHPTNALVAEDFIQKELGIESLDGSIVMTFATIESLLRDIGPIYIPEYTTTISYENAYYKSQMFSEKGSFPGSTQKRDFLDALVSEILLKFSSPSDAAKMLMSIRGSFDDKKIAAYFKDDVLQQIFDTYHWSGRQLPPSCINESISESSSCDALYIFPVEANLGVNKANAFVSRHYSIHSKINEDGSIEGEFTTTFTNSSIQGVYPGGVYKNYYQLFLPPGTTILSLKTDNSIVKGYDLENSSYTKLGYLLNIKEGQTLKFIARFRLKEKLEQSNSTFQVIVQKQLGLPQSDLKLTFEIPPNYVYGSSNFSPLAYKDGLEYNSSVDSDKIYYLHFQ